MGVSPPARVVWIEICNSVTCVFIFFASPPARVVWIEITTLHTTANCCFVATREGGVD